MKSAFVLLIRATNRPGARVSLASLCRVALQAPYSNYRDRGIGTSLLVDAENRLAPHGLNKLSVLMLESGTRVRRFLSRGFVLKKNLRNFEWIIPVQRQLNVPVTTAPLRNLADQVRVLGLYLGDRRFKHRPA